MALAFFEALHEKNLLSAESIAKIRSFYRHPRTSLRLEIQWLLYIGVALVSSGAAMLIYKYIDQLGHLAIILTLSLATAACYGWCLKVRLHRPQAGEQESSPLPDYILLLGALLLLTLVGYLQAEFRLFGNRWGLATFLPMVLLFTTAYYFDHRGVLALAVTNLATWLGITINQSSLYGLRELDSTRTIVTAVMLGVLLILLSIVVKQKNFRPHFEGTYHQFGTHFFFIGTIAAIIDFEKIWPLWLALLLAGAWYHYLKALKENSFYYMVVTVLYTYVAASYVVMSKLIGKIGYSQMVTYLILFYFIGSGIGVATLLVSLNKKIRANDRLSHS